MTTELMVLPEFKFSQFTPAVIVFNGEEIKAALVKCLEKYQNLKVTEETYADDKKLAQDIKKLIRAIDRERIDRTKEATAPITAYGAEMNGLKDEAMAVLSPLEAQIKQFDEQRLAEIHAAITNELANQTVQKGLRAEFADFSGLAQSLTKLTAVTKTGALTAKTEAEVLAAINEQLNLQNRVDLRLAQLEAECYRLGLNAPLNQAHVNHILLADDATYQAELEKIIAAEMQREEQAVAAQKRKIEAEAKAKAEAEAQAQLAAERAEMQAQMAQQQAAQPAQPAAIEQPAPVAPAQQQATKGKTLVTCTFEVDVPAHVPNAAIEAKFKKQLAEANFTTLVGIEIQRPQQEETAA